MFTAIIIRDSGNNGKEILANYERTAAARKGVSSPTDLQSIGLLTRLGGGPPGNTQAANVLEINQPPSNTASIHSDMLALRIEPAPAKVSVELAAEGQPEPIVYAPLPASFSRRPGTRTITFEFTVDSIITPRAMGLRAADWAKRVKGKNWIGDYILFLESLTLPLPALGRRPWLALKHGADVHGASRFGLQLEGVSTEDAWHGPDGMQSAKINLRLREYLVV